MTDDGELVKIEEEIKKLEEMDKGGYGSPTHIAKETIIKFFNRVLDIPKTLRISNLNKTELGIIPMSVRGNLRIGLYCEVAGLNKVADYFRSNAEILTESSMGKEGFWPQLFVTQIKKEGKVKELTEAKKGMFAKKEASE